MFQRRKARGMKVEGERMRRRDSGGRGEVVVICWVKTGKNIVMAKVRKTALARWWSFLKRVQRETTFRRGGSSVVVVETVDVPTVGWRRRRSMNARRALMETKVAVRK